MKSVIKVILFIVVFAIFMDIVSLLFFKRTPEITIDLIELIEKNNKLKNVFGDFRGSEIQYIPINQSDETQYRFEAIMKGSDGKVKIEGNTVLQKKYFISDWVITNYNVVSDSTWINLP